MKRKSLPDVICLPHGSAADWRPPMTRRRLAAMGGVVVVLAGCTTLGTNINAEFTCGPSNEGSCAPATVIDDRALAEITGDSSYLPAGPYQTPVRQLGPGSVALAAGPTPQAVPGQQKVLRIVFPAHVDRAGRYHEASVVKAVVDNGQWIAASPSNAVAMAPSLNLTVNPEILSQMGDEVAEGQPIAAETPARVGVNDTRLPSAEAVAAARARGAARSSASAAAGRGETGVVPVNRPQLFNPVVED
jgi:conjugal transfer pilus assembly protein TraV